MISAQGSISDAGHIAVLVIADPGHLGADHHIQVFAFERFRGTPFNRLQKNASHLLFDLVPFHQSYACSDMGLDATCLWTIKPIGLPGVIVTLEISFGLGFYDSEDGVTIFIRSLRHDLVVNFARCGCWAMLMER
ncbi:hypothetical protein [Ruegeria sp. HKCCA6707]|uniref:hypothetical protein n=1 Tax=Ruegeria sp. HKCCA6707 TaxID=2682996 RepID=UPI001489C541|nr:hypothetical protein [Ruegeria sp. HKCCA6707]